MKDIGVFGFSVRILRRSLRNSAFIVDSVSIRKAFIPFQVTQKISRYFVVVNLTVLFF